MRLAFKLLSLTVPFILSATAAYAQQPPPSNQPPPLPNQAQPPAKAPSSDNANQQEGVEVQARGQVHEAFASPSLERQEATPVIMKKPPEPVNELPPDQKPEGDNISWIPGYWMYDDERADFLWVSGTWRNIPPDRRWMPGYWVEAEKGYRWVSGYWMDQDDTQVNLLPEPPARIEESVPTYDEATETYVPGMWVYRDNRYAWRPGYRIPLQAGWVWSPANYRWTPGGYVFVDGYWDYDLSRRGFAFAPVIINSGYFGRPNWYYRPNYVIGVDFLQGSLFVNAGWNHYYFGDYYDNRYSQRGYLPWISYRNTARMYDPLFSYYRWQNRNDGRWYTNLQNNFNGRRDGSIARPGRTFADLNRASAQGQTGAGIVALNQVKSDAFKLSTNKQNDKYLDQYRDLRTQRGRSEAARRASMANDPTPGKSAVEPGKNVPPPVRPGNPPTKTDDPPAKTHNPPAKTDTPPSKTDTPPQSNQGNRYEVPKSGQTYQRGNVAPPQRPQPPPVQNNPGRGGNAPAKSGGNPGKKG